MKQGETFTNKQGLTYEIIEYINNEKILVEFHDERKTQRYTRKPSIISGGVVNPYHATVHGHGYLGIGNYSTKDKSVYNCWNAMVTRCYSKIYAEKNFTNPNKTFNTVSSKWLDYQQFAEWYNKQEFKDMVGYSLTCFNFTEYCPLTSGLIPSKLNTLITDYSFDGINLPTGISLDKNGKSYRVDISKNSKKIILGYYKSVEEARNVLLTEKSKFIQEVVEKYKKDMDNDTYTKFIEYYLEMEMLVGTETFPMFETFS